MTAPPTARAPRCVRAALLCALVIALAAPAAAHYNLKDPMPYNPIDCNRPDCHGPCPPFWEAGSKHRRNSPQKPSRVWRRGQRVPIEWHRNNHEGGFYRRSLVPVKYMNSKYWHKQLAFEFGCWNQNRFWCGRKASCGTDKNGLAYRNMMTVPAVYPDGDYVFAMVWYGGTHWKTRKAFFSDYYTCAFVRIQGGAFRNRHVPQFVPGRNHRGNVPRGKCMSTSSFVGQCGGEECTGVRAWPHVPGEFKNGKRPGPITRSMLNGRAGNQKQVPLTSPRTNEKRAVMDNRRERKKDLQMAREEEAARRRKQIQRRKAVWKPKKKVVWKPKKQTWKPKKKAWKPKPWKRPAWKRPKKATWKRPAWKRPAWKRPAWKRPKKTVWKRKSWTKPACWKKMPPAPVGAWGPRNSGLWWRQRAKWWNHHNYCMVCKC